MIRHHESSAALCRYVREQTGDTVILPFSCGKDAVAAWLQLRRYFDRIIPVHFEAVPGLSFVREAIAYYERFFGTTIHVYPHPSFFRMLRGLVFQPPERCATIEEIDFPKFDYANAQADLRKRFNAPNAYAGTGVRAADSLIRRAAARTHGTLNPRKREFWPVYDWVTADLDREFRAVNVKLPVDYEMFGRTFDGIDERFLRPIKERFPDDYARILEWFPLADLEIFRRNLSPEISRCP